MESFEITVDYKGAKHLLNVQCDSEEPEYRIFRGEEPLGTVKPETEHDLYWVSEDMVDEEFIEKIGERIEKYHR